MNNKHNIFKENRCFRGISWQQIITFALALTLSSVVTAQNPAPEVNIIKADRHGLILEFQIENNKAPLSSIIGGDKQKTLNIPMHPVLITAPAQGEINIMVTDSEYGNNDPFASQQANSDFFPGKLVVKGISGKMAGQQVMQLVFYPLQINPTDQSSRLYTRIRVQISFEQAIAKKAQLLNQIEFNAIYHQDQAIRLSAR